MVLTPSPSLETMGKHWNGYVCSDVLMFYGDTMTQFGSLQMENQTLGRTGLEPNEKRGWQTLPWTNFSLSLDFDLDVFKVFSSNFTLTLVELFHIVSLIHRSYSEADVRFLFSPIKCLSGRVVKATSSPKSSRGVWKYRVLSSSPASSNRPFDPVWSSCRASRPKSMERGS